jgi:Fe-S-cluster-containing dehydrogenase component
MFEEEDVCTAYWHPYVQRRAKVFDPPGEVKTETEIWRLMCERFGFETSWFPHGDGEVREAVRRMLPAGLTLEDLEAGPGLARGVADIAFEDHKFPTPSGRIEFASDEAARTWGVDAVPDYAPLPEGHASDLAARFPLQLLSCKTRDRIHSQFGNLDWVRDVERPHALDMHPADAAVRGLREGDVAAVWNERGRIELRVRFDEGLRPGVAHVLEGHCHDGDPDINVLTDAGVTDMNHGATFYECLVEVTRTADSRPRTADGGRRMADSGQPAAAAGSKRQTAATGQRAAGSGNPTGNGGGRRKTAPPATDSGGAGLQACSSRAFLLDLARCVGCSACVLACRLENGWSGAAPWRRVLPLNLRRRPGGPTYFFSVACHHCEQPACLAACPSGAYEKRADGIVVHHEDKCVGCRYCEMACPFGAPRYSEEKQVMTKCHFCHHRVDGGERPACVTACPTEALQAEPRSSLAFVAGFADPAGCRPTTRFRPPRGARREALSGALEERLRK